MKNKIFITLFSLIGVIVGFYIFYHNPKQSNDIDPVSFSHYVHVKEHKIKCINCHRGTDTQIRAGIPDIDVCSTCHSSIINPASNREEQVYNFVKDNKNIPWRTFFNVPDYVYFSHRRHVNIAKLDCTACHGDMTSQDSSNLKNIHILLMQDCVKCHEEKNITTECGNCHH